MHIDLSRVHFPVTTLGPGRRVGIWLQGCSIRCPGCISADTWGFGRGRTTVAATMAVVQDWLIDADGVTISGGEPFDQPRALLALIHALRLRANQDLLVYSGHPIEALTATLAEASGLVDAVISDPFDSSSGQSMALRGSDNQRLHVLTNKGRRRLSALDRRLTDADRTLDVMFDDDGSVWLAGVPRQGDIGRLQQMLHAQGHHILTTETTKGIS